MLVLDACCSTFKKKCCEIVHQHGAVDESIFSELSFFLDELYRRKAIQEGYSVSKFGYRYYLKFQKTGSPNIGTLSFKVEKEEDGRPARCDSVLWNERPREESLPTQPPLD